MRTSMRLVVIAAILALAAPVFAASGPVGKDGYTAQACLDHLAKMRDSGWSGFDAMPNEKGEMVISSVPANGPGVAAGFQVGDVLVSANGVKYADKKAMHKAMMDWKVGSQVTYTVNRGGAEQQVAVTLVQMPEDVFAAMVGNHMIHDHMAPASTVKAEATSKQDMSK